MIQWNYILAWCIILTTIGIVTYIIVGFIKLVLVERRSKKKIWKIRLKNKNKKM